MTPTLPPTVASPAGRLRGRTDIRAVFAARGGARSRAADVRARDRGDEGPPRWTVVAGRKVGNAVCRNRAKRRLRAVLRGLSLPAGTDLVVIAKPAAVELPFADLCAEVAGALEKVRARAEGRRR